MNRAKTYDNEKGNLQNRPHWDFNSMNTSAMKTTIPASGRFWKDCATIDMETTTAPTVNRNSHPAPYSVRINGRETAVEKIRVSAFPFNRLWPGHQRPEDQSEDAYVVRAIGNGPVSFQINPDSHFSGVVVRPLSKGIRPEIKDGTVSFSISRHGQYTVEIDGPHNAIHLFYDKPKDFGAYGHPTRYFGSGKHYPGLIKVKSGERIFIDEGAEVFGNIFGVDVKDVKIYGYGVLNGGREERREIHGDIGWDDENVFDPEKVHTFGCVRMFRCRGITLDGVTFCDPASYAVSFFACEDISINNVKVVGLWKYNNDGIDFVNTRNAVIKDSFVRSFDDCVCLKGLTAFSDRNVENVRVSGCVFWCDWGLTCEIGFATACAEIRDVVFSDCDLIHNASVCLDIKNGQWADVHDIRYENVNIEYPDGCTPPQIQDSDEARYSGGGTHVPLILSVSDRRRNWQGNVSGDDRRCRIRRVSIKNLNIVTESPEAESAGIRVEKCMPFSDYQDITIDGLRINGKKTTSLEGYGEEVSSNINLKRAVGA